jgi:predicted GIY-YIG superfamily endonuclease
MYIVTMADTEVATVEKDDALKKLAEWKAKQPKKPPAPRAPRDVVKERLLKKREEALQVSEEEKEMIRKEKEELAAEKEAINGKLTKTKIKAKERKEFLLSNRAPVVQQTGPSAVSMLMWGAVGVGLFVLSKGMVGPGNNKPMPMRAPVPAPSVPTGGFRPLNL